MAERFINLAPRAIRVARGILLQPGEVMHVEKCAGRLMAAQRGRMKIRRIVDVQHDLHTNEHAYPDKHCIGILKGMGEAPTRSPRKKLTSVIDKIAKQDPGPVVHPLTGKPLKVQPATEEVIALKGEPVEPMPIDERRALVAQMVADGATHQEMADVAGVSAATIGNDIKVIEAEAAKDEDEAGEDVSADEEE